MKVPLAEEPVDLLLEQHRAVLTYERWVQAGCWSDIEATFPDGPPECRCLVCRQLAAFSDRVVLLMGTELFNKGALEDAELLLKIHELQSLTRHGAESAAPISHIDEFTPRRRARGS